MARGKNERLAYVENNSLDITALVALLFRLCDHYAERVSTYPSKWERFLVAVLQNSFRQGLLGTSGVLESEDMRDEASETPDPWFPPYEMRQKAQAKAYFEGDGSLVRQREGETFVECMERAAQLALDRDKEFPTDSKKGTVYVEPSFLAGADGPSSTSSADSRAASKLIVLHSGKDGKVNWSAAKFIWILTGYEGQATVPLYGLVHAGFCRKLIERQLADHPLLRPTDYIMSGSGTTGGTRKPLLAHTSGRKRLRTWSATCSLTSYRGGLTFRARRNATGAIKPCGYDPDRGKCPPRPSARIDKERKKRHGDDMVNRMLNQGMQELWSNKGLPGEPMRLIWGDDEEEQS
ncbi:hypothetical protein JCM10296v2_006578 [Rhodotorula toruloides]